MHFDVVLSEFIHPCTKKQRRAQYSRGVDAHVCVRALQMCVCMRFRCVRACASDVCVRALQMCVCARFRCVRALQMCVCVLACTSDVCVRALQMCVCALQMCACASDVCVRACVHFRCVRWKLLTQHSTVTPTIPSIIYARLVPSGSPYMESVRLNENARVGGNA